MAMRPRTPTFRAQPSFRPVYETLQPKSEMKENPESYLLHVYLPGFIKERIRITYVGSTRMVRISGERPIQGNRWIRFDQTYPVPENCEGEKLQGKFELGTLILTMPKKLISQVSPKQEVKTKTTQENGPPDPSEKDVPEANPEKAKETIPPQYTTTKVGEPIGDKASLPSPVKDPDALKGQKGTQEDTLSERPIESLKPEDEKGLRALIPQKGQEETVKRPIVTSKPETKIQTDEKSQKDHQEEVEPKPTLTTVTRDQAEEKGQEEIRLKTKLPTVKKQLEEKTVNEDAEKERVLKKEVKGGGKPNDIEKAIFKEKEMRTNEVSPKENRLKTKLATVEKQLEEKAVAEDDEKERISKKEVKEGGKPNDMEKATFKEKEMRTSEVSPKENRLKTKLATVEKQLEEKTVAEDAEKEKISKKEVKEGGKPKDMEKAIFKEKEMRTREVSPKESAEPSGPKIPEKSKEDIIDTVGSIGIRELAASASQVVTTKAEGKWNEEEKQLVVNMGAAVLVIAALGAYISYRFASST